MRLSKSDALFLYKILYHYSLTNQTSNHLSDDDFEALEHLTQDLHDFILTEQSSFSGSEDASSVEDEEENEEEEDEEDEEVSEGDEEPTADVTVEALENLKAVSVVTPAGQKSLLEFESVEGGVDALIDGGSIIIDGVTHLRVTENSINLYTGDEWHEFDYKKLPKAWSNLLKTGELYEVIDTDEEEE